MQWLDCLIVGVPFVLLLATAVYIRRYIRGVADFLSAGRICGRYVLMVGNVAGAISIIGLLAYIEVHYKTGFALNFWQYFIFPLTIIISLTGYCTYRFRETKAMSLGQLLEMRYSRRFRIFAAALRSLSEMLANMIMPALGARFFIYFFDLPQHIDIFGFQFPTFMLLVLAILVVAVFIIWMGGALAIVVTGALQGILFYPLVILFIVFILYKFSWNQEIIPVMLDRAPGESFLNPFDISKLRDFNLFFLVVLVFDTIMHRASWLGGGISSSAKSPHEQKMAGVLTSWGTSLVTVFYVLMAVMLLTLMNHRNFSSEAKMVRDKITAKISEELITDTKLRAEIGARVFAIPPQEQRIGIDPPLSEAQNLDTTYLDAVHDILKKEPDGNAVFQQFKTLYHQLSYAVAMRNLLPPVVVGLFVLLLIFAMLSTDDSRMFSAAITIMQDVIMPLRKKPLSPEAHIRAVRWVSVGVGVFFFFGSFFMAQLDYINLFVVICVTMWMGGCGPVMIFGLYSRFGTTAGAWASLLTGMFMAFGGMFLQRNWADLIYPLLDRYGWVEPVGWFLETTSAPLSPYVVWKMDAVKFPVNSYEIYLITTLVTLVLYILVSRLTYKEPFNLDRMLHRGKYNLDGDDKSAERWSWRSAWGKLIGITPAYSTGDKVIAWAVFIYSFIYVFFGTFLIVLIWNLFSPRPAKWWGDYFFITSLVVPFGIAAVTAVWFTIGGVRDLIAMFRELHHKKVNELDNGWVEGHVSIADKEELDNKDQ